MDSAQSDNRKKQTDENDAFLQLGFVLACEYDSFFIIKTKDNSYIQYCPDRWRKMLLKRGVQGYLIKNGTHGQCTITNVAVKGGGRDGFTQCVCDYSFTDNYGQMHTGKHTFLPNKRISIGNYFPVIYAEKNGKMLSDIIE